MAEGLIPTQRITVQNPAHYLHGLVVDYDVPLKDGDINGIPDRGASGLLPTWISKTFSGHGRVVFEFESPVLVNHEELYDRWIKLLAKELRLNNLEPGLDKNSFKLSQYFELGRHWTRVAGGKPIPSTLLHFLLVRGATAKDLPNEGPTIPIEEVAAEVERQYPGLWSGDFSPGARGPLFWVTPFVDREGCQVGDYGMICYSERAFKPFLTWREILGPDFVRNYEAKRIGAAAEKFWFAKPEYVRKTEFGQWAHRTKEDTIMWLKNQGISARTGPKKNISDAERVLLAIQETREVKAAIPFVLDSRELIYSGGYRFLSTNVKKAMVPAEKGEPTQFPWLHKFFHTIWDLNQRNYFFAWLQRFWVSGHQGRLKSGHALIIAGGKDRGKTLLSQFIIGSIMGGFADATRYLLGETNFNQECSENAHWCVDDAKGLTTPAKRREFAEAIKKQIANPNSPFEAKFKEAGIRPWKGRIVITTNVDPDSLAIIPPLDNTIDDKIMLFKFREGETDFLDSDELEALILKELPFFLAWLRDWKPPAYVLSDRKRYGIKPWHHPELKMAAQEVSPHYGFMDTLIEWLANLSPDAKNGGTMELSPSALLARMNREPELRGVLRYYNDNNMGRTLRAIMKLPGTPVIGVRQLHGRSLYRIKETP
jgi:hypothetical protein